jgi:regulator of RNase E activity RraA
MSTQRPASAEIHPGPGFRVRHEFPRLPAQVCKALLEFDTPTISDQLNRLYAVSPAIHCLTDATHRVAAPVCTVRCYPGDNLMVHKALDVAQPGDVIAIDASFAHGAATAVLGDLIATKARHREIAGFVVDGLVRDIVGIREVDMPVFARGTTPVGPLHRGPGEINFPIALGGIVTYPGDVVVADAAGIVVVPQDAVEELLLALGAKQAASAAYHAAVRRGEFSNRWVDEMLERQNCLRVAEPSPIGFPS